MDKKKVVGWTAVGIAVLMILYYLRKKNVTPAAIPASTSDFTSPYTDWANGNYPGSQNMNGSDGPFQSINVNVNIPMLSRISNDYIPVFGFTGVVATGG